MENITLLSTWEDVVFGYTAVTLVAFGDGKMICLGFSKVIVSVAKSWD